MEVNNNDLVESAISAFNYHVLFPDYYPLESLEVYGFNAGYHGYPMDPPDLFTSIPSLLCGWHKGWKEAMRCDLENEISKANF